MYSLSGAIESEFMCRHVPRAREGEFREERYSPMSPEEREGEFREER